ncbi:MAG: DNA repair ATPase [Verrucomicrobia bacterium]|nr:DNA repair ATPase [Verrucomicrobiota bacterium]
MTSTPAGLRPPQARRRPASVARVSHPPALDRPWLKALRAPRPRGAPALEQGTYEILRARLAAQGAELRTRLEQLNRARQEVFGAIPTALLATERITTPNNCLARDLIPLGGQRFLFGYNVHFGLRSEIQLADVFGLYELRDHRFAELPLTPLADERFLADFRSLYHYYRHTVFAKFSLDGPFLFMVFRVGKAIPDIKTFKWHCQNGRLTYVGNRFDHEYHYPPTHEFEWTRTHRELHRSGLHPHISIDDRVFVECVGGDLTVKVEDNTASGEGIYSEPVEQKDQTLDDAEIYYAIVGSLILLKIRPYQEPRFRYLVFNEKLKEVRRIDALAEACVLLPDQQGIVFPRGYYLQSGECKLFETALTDMVFYKRIVSPNGEDVLYTFYNRLSGHYVLLSYNLIARTVETPIICGGFSLFDNGEMALFRVEDEPQKHHALQIWQTPYLAQAWQPDVPSTSYLHTIGNPELVRAMAECQEVLTLLGKDDTYGDLYLDLVRRSADILDTYFWLDRPDTFRLREPLHGLHQTAAAALAEFDKVLRLRRTATQTLQQAVRRVTDLLRAISQTRFERLADFVQRLHELRALRGELLSSATSAISTAPPSTSRNNNSPPRPPASPNAPSPSSSSPRPSTPPAPASISSVPPSPAWPRSPTPPPSNRSSTPPPPNSISSPRPLPTSKSRTPPKPPASSRISPAFTPSSTRPAPPSNSACASSAASKPTLSSPPRPASSNRPSPTTSTSPPRHPSATSSSTACSSRSRSSRPASPTSRSSSSSSPNSAPPSPPPSRPANSSSSRPATAAPTASSPPPSASSRPSPTALAASPPCPTSTATSPPTPWSRRSGI